MRSPNRSNVTSTLLAAFLLVSTPAAVFAHAGHGNEFEGGADASHSPAGIEVDAQTLQRMGIQVKPVSRESMELGIKATGQIETLPNQQVEVTAPIAGKVVQLSIEPGDAVEAGETVAVLSSPEIASLRVESLEKQAEAEADLKQAEANLTLAKQNYQRQIAIADAEIEQAEKQLAIAEARYDRDKAIVDDGGVLTIAKENYQRQVELAAAEIAAAERQVAIAETRYDRDKAVVDEKALLNIAQENYQRQVELAAAEIARSETELSVAQEQYDRDTELAEQGAIPRRQMLESQAKLASVKAELARAKSRLGEIEAQSEVKRAEVNLPLRDLRESEELLARSQAELARAKSRLGQLQAQSEVKRAEVDLPLRDLRESEDLLAQAKAQLTRVKTRQNVLEAEAEVKRAEAALTVAKSRVNLSDRTYNTRLKQLGVTANDDGTVTVTAPIAGVVAHRDIALGQSVDAAGVVLMTIQDNTQVGATANIYEKDLEKVQLGQRVNVKVTSFPDRTFTGRITYISSTVNSDTRVIPVRAKIDNIGGELKPGMFAELEVATAKTNEAVTVIPASAVVEVNQHPVVYVQNGQNFQPVDVVLGEAFGDKIAVKSGLFEGDKIVTEGAMQLYAQSLRGGHSGKDDHSHETTDPVNSSSFIFHPSFLLLGLAVPGISAIAAGAFWLGRRTKPSIKANAAEMPQNEDLPDSAIESVHDFPMLVENNHHARKE